MGYTSSARISRKSLDEGTTLGISRIFMQLVPLSYNTLYIRIAHRLYRCICAILLSSIANSMVKTILINLINWSQYICFFQISMRDILYKTYDTYSDGNLILSLSKIPLFMMPMSIEARFYLKTICIIVSKVLIARTYEHNSQWLQK